MHGCRAIDGYHLIVINTCSSASWARLGAEEVVGWRFQRTRDSTDEVPPCGLSSARRVRCESCRFSSWIV